MSRSSKKRILLGSAFIVAFIIWTLLLRLVDVQAIGPQSSSVGFANLNRLFHSLTGTNMTLYIITDWLGLVPIGIAFGFAILGIIQWIKRKSILSVDKSILALGIFYIVVMAIYFLFEFIVINRRPILINGYLEASYPSSTTMLVMCVMPTAIMHFKARIKNNTIRNISILISGAFIAFMVIGRLVSGVHWLSDIIGGALISAGLVTIYSAFTE